MNKPQRIALAILIAMVAILYAAPAFAGTGSWFDDVGGYFGSALATVATGLFGWLIHSKLKIDATSAAGKMLDGIVADSVSYASQIAKKKIAATGTKLAGNEKLDLAISYAHDLITHHKLPLPSKDALVKMIEAKVAKATSTEH